MRTFLEAGADVLLRKNEIETCLVAVDGSCRQTRIFVKLEIHDANNVYISGVLAASEDNLNAILTDKAGIIQLIDKNVSDCVFPQTKIDLNKEPVIGLTIPGIQWKVLRHLENSDADDFDNPATSRQEDEEQMGQYAARPSYHSAVVHGSEHIIKSFNSKT